MAQHKFLFLDFESYYSQTYSLKTMTPPEYILNPQWETIGCAANELGEPARWIDGPDFAEFIKGYDPENTTTVTFNALFDNCVLAWRYGFIPKRMFCSMRMTAALRGHVLKEGVSLASVSRHFGLPPKGTVIGSVRGMRRADIMAIPQLWQDYQEYSCHDNWLSEQIFVRQWPEFPAAERRIMDRVLRCAVQPRFHVDTEMLQSHLADLKVAKQEMLIEAGCPIVQGDSDEMIENKILTFSKTLRSDKRFKDLLEAHGVDIKYKPSASTLAEDGTPKMIPQFAKTDDFMEELQEHEDDKVQALACARLGLRSTIEETRGRRMFTIANCDWSCYRDGNFLPMPLTYSAAHTHRLGGGWKINPQNFPSARQKGSKLRKSLIAPPGCKVVVADKSQVECRVNAELCGQQDLLETFRTGGDPYAGLAAKIFGCPVDKKTADGMYRFIGKGGVLGLGFQCAAKKFYNMVIRQARTLGMDTHKLLEIWNMDLSEKSVDTYRSTNTAIVGKWYWLRSVLETAWMGAGDPVQFGPCVIGHGFVEGPGGLTMRYGNPRWESDEEFGQTLMYTYAGRNHRIYGGAFLENIVQFVARIITMNDALRIGDRTGYQFALQSHDELAFIVPEAEAEAHLKVCIEEMSKSPSWAPDMPMGAEGNIGDSYGEAK